MNAARRISLVLLGGSLMAAGVQAGEEGKGCPAKLSDFDLNGDGVIVEQEWSEGHAQRFEKMADEGRKMKNAGNMPTFASIDLDGDGKVDQGEFAAHKKDHQHKHQHQHQGNNKSDPSS